MGIKNVTKQEITKILDKALLARGYDFDYAVVIYNDSIDSLITLDSYNISNEILYTYVKNKVSYCLPLELINSIRKVGVGIYSNDY